MNISRFFKYNLWKYQILFEKAEGNFTAQNMQAETGADDLSDIGHGGGLRGWPVVTGLSMTSLFCMSNTLHAVYHKKIV